MVLHYRSYLVLFTTAFICFHRSCLYSHFVFHTIILSSPFDLLVFSCWTLIKYLILLYLILLVSCFMDLGKFKLEFLKFYWLVLAWIDDKEQWWLLQSISMCKRFCITWNIHQHLGILQILWSKIQIPFLFFLYIQMSTFNQENKLSHFESGFQFMNFDVWIMKIFFNMLPVWHNTSI